MDNKNGRESQSIDDELMRIAMNCDQIREKAKEMGKEIVIEDSYSDIDLVSGERSKKIINPAYKSQVIAASMKLCASCPIGGCPTNVCFEDN